jgi:hypothetical protein
MHHKARAQIAVPVARARAQGQGEEYDIVELAPAMGDTRTSFS